MKLKTFSDDISLNTDSKGLYILSRPTILAKNFEESQYGVYIVSREEEMRLDLISKKIYSDSNHVEELMKINNIYNPFSIKRGDIIRYIPKYNELYVNEEDVDIKDIHLTNTIDSKETKPESVVPSVKPKNKEQIKTDKSSNKLKIINNFK